MSRMSDLHVLVNDLLESGYSSEDITKLVAMPSKVWYNAVADKWLNPPRSTIVEEKQMDMFVDNFNVF